MVRHERNSPSVTPRSNIDLSYVLDGLLADDMITKQQAARLKREGTRGEVVVHPLVRVAEQGWSPPHDGARPLSLERLTRWLAERTDMEYMRLDPLKIDVHKITSYVSQTYATKLQILPVAVEGDELVVASAEPFVDHWVMELENIARLRVRRVLINPQDLTRYLGEFYGVSRSIFGAMGDKPGQSLSLLQNFEQLLEVGKVGEPDANDQHVVSIVDWLLQFAFEQRASDIHLEPRREKGLTRFRIDGRLHVVHEFPTPVLAAITSRLKSLARMDVTDRRRPQDGRIKTVTPSGKEVEMRLSSMPSAFGEVLVLRIFDPDMLVKDFAQLGFGKYEMSLYQPLLSSPHGILLVTGPTGSGKTTTLYSSLYQLAKPELNICTIEDPIEMVEAQFNQMQVQPVIGVDFASGVRTLLRQDPDIIMVGEIRDRETASIAVQAALTGHLVLSSLHTNDAPSAITRLLDIGVQSYLINATLLGVLAQRLVRMLCQHCKVPGTVSRGDWDAFVAPYTLRCPQKAFLPKGCEECRHTGYFGRGGIYEILVIDADLRELIGAGADLDGIKRHALKRGMRSLKVSAAQKVARGLTTLAEGAGVLPQHTGVSSST